MRFVYTYILVAFVTMLFAQKPPNFSMTDIHGKQWNLYNELGKGKSVVLDFFFVDCKPCQRLTPIVQSVYESYGSDTGNVIVFGISNRDNNARITQFESTYGVTYPSCGIDGGGDTITDLYQLNYTFLGWPTYAVICPDTTIFWAIEQSDSLPALVDSLKQCPEPILSLQSTVRQKNQVTIVQNHKTNTITIKTRNQNHLQQVSLYNAQGQKCDQQLILKTAKSIALSTSMLPSGVYYMYIVTQEGTTIQKCMIP